MPRSVPALVNPELLLWARESAGWSIEDASKKIRVRPEKVESWESGNSQPTIIQLRKLGSVYRRPIAVFYLPERPKDFAPIKDYRRFPDHLLEDSPAIAFQIRRAHERRVIALELLEIQDEEPMRFNLKSSLSVEPESLGEKIRKFLGLSVDAQKAWKNGYDALNFWRRTLESKGVLVFQATGIEPKEMRGFSIVDFPLPVLVANTKDVPVARTFTLAHELVHVILRKGGVCDFSEPRQRRAEDDPMEIFCNHVAGATLVPKRDLLAHPVVASHSKKSESWTDQEIRTLTSRYQVSREALLRRLLILDRTTKAFYERKREEYNQAFIAERLRAKPGFAPPDRMAIAQAGEAFTSLVLRTYRVGRITSADVSEYLGVRLKHVTKIQDTLGV